MFDKLLLPIDPSKRLKPARDYAVALAQKFDISLTAIFVSNPSKTGTVTASKDTRDGIVALGKRQLEQFVEETKEIKVKSVLKTGVRHEVLSKMEEIDCQRLAQSGNSSHVRACIFQEWSGWSTCWTQLEADLPA